MIFFFALAILLFLSNFGLCGTVGAFLKRLQTGLFGIPGYIFPVFIAAGIVISRYIPLLNDVSGVVAGDVPRPSDRETLIILGIGAALTLPLLPLRSMVTAAYVNGLRE